MQLMPRRLKVPASEHSESIKVRPDRRVLSNSLNSGLSPQSDVLSRYGSFGIAGLFFRITRASWACIIIFLNHRYRFPREVLKIDENN